LRPITLGCANIQGQNADVYVPYHTQNTQKKLTEKIVVATVLHGNSEAALMRHEQAGQQR